MGIVRHRHDRHWPTSAVKPEQVVHHMMGILSATNEREQIGIPSATSAQLAHGELAPSPPPPIQAGEPLRVLVYPPYRVSDFEGHGKVPSVSRQADAPAHPHICARFSISRWGVAFLASSSSSYFN